MGQSPNRNAAGGGSVTQLTSITTGVEIDKHYGTITTVSQTLGAGAEATFTVSNNIVKPTDNIIVSLANTDSAGGPFDVFITNISDGSFDITISNTGGVAGDNTLDINYSIKNNL